MTIGRDASPAAVYREWQRCMSTQDYEGMRRVVDFAGYTEICLGLTGWTTGYEVALGNYMKNMMTPWEGRETTEEDVVEGTGKVTVRSRITATHVGEFLGVAPTRRRITWDNISIVEVEDGRIVGQWAQPDLWGIYQQLVAPQ